MGFNTISSGASTETTNKYTYSYADFAAAATANSLTLNLPLGTILTGVLIKHSAAFGGGAVASYGVSVGIAGNLEKYASSQDVFQAVSGSALRMSGTGPWCESKTTAPALQITATCSGANLNAATAGSVDIWLFTELAN